MPDCICRNLLEKTAQRSVAFCSLKQSCENALRDWNKVHTHTHTHTHEKTDQRSVAFCSLKQSCENALRDWNKVFWVSF